MANEYKLSFTGSQIDAKLKKIDNLATKAEIPTKTSQLTNDSKFLTDYTEADPTVPAWAKEATKPKYTASEVGALPDTTVIPTVPTKVSAFFNDAGYLTQHQSLDGLATTEEIEQLSTEVAQLEDKIQTDINAALSAKEFDLVAMGMPIVEVDGEEVEFAMDTSAIRQAAQNGTVRAKLNIKIGSLTYNNTVIDFSYFEVETVGRNRYLVASVPAVGTSFSCQILIDENRIITSAYTLSAGGASVPTYAGVVEVE